MQGDPMGIPIPLEEKTTQCEAKYKLTEEMEKRISNSFVYHSPKDNQPERYTTIREFACDLATLICQSCPDSRERSLALTKLEEAVMWANSSIARNE